MTRFFAPRLRRIAITVPLIAALLVVTVPLGGCSLADVFAVFESDSPALAHEGPTAATVISERLDTFGSDLAVLADPSAEETATQTAREGVELFAGDFEELAADLEDQFAETREVLKEIDSPEKDKIQADTEAEFAERADTLREHLGEIDKADGGEELAVAATACSEWLDEVTPDPVYQPLGTELPNQIVDYEAGPPVLGTQVAPAYAPDLPDSEPSTLPVTPTEEDLAETIEVQFTEDIRSLVTTLGADPVRMYEYVRNTIDFEPYYGSRKGANETLLQGAGNDMDTASLLIAMYRNAGYPARYVSGVVDVPIDQAMNWVGVEVPEAAAKLFSAAGTPTTSLISGGKINELRIEHTWAEVYVPYEDYRGAVGSPEGAERGWVPLDASFKQYEVDRLQDTLAGSLPEFATSDALAAMCDFGDVGSACSVDASAAAELFKGAFDAAALIASETQPASVSVIPTSLPVTENPTLLPPPGCEPVEISSEWCAVPSEYTEQLVVTMSGRTASLPLPSLGGRSLMATYLISGADEEIAQAAQATSDLPAYAVAATPVLLLGEEDVLQGDKRCFGSPFEIEMEIRSPAGASQPIRDSLIVGGTYCIAANSGTSTMEHLRTTRNDVASAYDAIGDATQVAETRASAIPQLFAAMLQLPLELYFAETRACQSMCSDILGIADVEMSSIAVSGLDMDIATVLGIPMRVKPAGLFMDVDLYDSVVLSRSGDSQAALLFAKAFGPTTSCLESTVLDQLCPDLPAATSTVTILRDAVEEGIPLVYLDEASAPAAISTLEYPSEFKQRLLEEVALARVVTVPQFAPEGATVFGWVSVDPVTGSSGYMIADGLGGTKKSFPEQDEWLPTQLLWDVGGFLTSLVVVPQLVGAGVLTSAAAVGLLTAALAIPSLAMTTYSFIGFVDWLMEQDLNWAWQAEYLLQATMRWLGIVGATAILACVPHPAASAAIFAVGAVGTVMFTWGFPAMLLVEQRFNEMAGVH